MIDLSLAAANEIRRLQHSRCLSDSYFRVSVKSGGCSGLYYVLELSEKPQQSDRIYASLGINIIIDPESNYYLTNLKLDYAEDLMGGGFRFYNPQATESCGCGLSFTVNSPI